MARGLQIDFQKMEVDDYMPQFRTHTPAKSTRIDYRTAPRNTYEIPFLMKLGNLSYSEAADLVSRHDGNRHEINAELIARRGPRA